MSGLKALFAVLGSGEKVIGSARNLIATAVEDRQIELVCCGEGSPCSGYVGMPARAS